jgi:hypothetical protein
LKQRLTGGVYAAVLVWVNAYICRDWLYHPTAHMNSLYGYWAALAKWGSWSWGPVWWPYWDFGSPLEFVSAPLVPATAAAIAAIRGVSHLMAVQTVSAIVYCAAPVVLFVTAWGLTRAPGASFVAALAYSLLSPIQILAPDNSFLWPRILEPHRFMLQAVWDETPRCAALTSVLLFLLLFERWLDGRNPRLLIAASFALALALLASPFAVISGALALLALLTARQAGSWRRESAAAAGAVLLGLALAARWLPPSMWMAMGASSAAHEPWGWGVPKYLAGAGVAWAVLVTAGERWIQDWRARWAVLWAFLMICGPVFERWLHATLLPQAHRFRLEAEAALALAAAFGLRAIIARMGTPLRIGALAAVVALAGVQVVHHRRLAKDALYPVKAEETVERRVAERLAREFPGAPVLLPGPMAHWGNWFAPVLQFAGSEGTAAYSQTQQRALVDVYAAQDVGASVATLESFGVAAVVSTPGRFDGILPALWSEGGFTAYRAPGEPTAVEWAGENRARVRVDGETRIPVSYHRGWRATADGQPVQLRRNPLGLISVTPGRAGLTTVDLIYDGGRQLRFWAWVSAAAGLLAIVALARGRLGR